jgi:putative alpha-1,2-mannosidase
VRLNGKHWSTPFLPYDAFKNGGALDFSMEPHPNKLWGIDGRPPE